MASAEVTQFTSLTNIKEKWGRRCDYFIVVGFAAVFAAQLYINYAPKPDESKKAFVGPPKPVQLVRR